MIYIYTEDNNSYINRFCRNKEINLKNKKILNFNINEKILNKLIMIMDIITNKNKLYNNTILYRGLRNVKFIKNFEIGSIFEEKGYCSASFDKKVSREYASGGWLMKIIAMKGTKGTYIRPYSSRPEEVEYLLPRNQKFLIMHKNEKEREFTVIIV